MIRYVDSSGWTWEVCEVARDLEAGIVPAAAAASPRERRQPVPFADAPAALRPPTRADRAAGAPPDPFAEDCALYFLSRLGTRKLRQYPTGWHELARTELEALCRSAEVV